MLSLMPEFGVFTLKGIVIYEGSARTMSLVPPEHAIEPDRVCFHTAGISDHFHQLVHTSVAGDSFPSSSHKR